MKNINLKNPVTNFVFASAIFLFVGCTNADTVIGNRCFRVHPPNAPQDNAWLKMWVTERGEPGSGIFDSEGFHRDRNGVNTPIHSTSYRTYAPDGTAQYTRFTYGVLGNVDRELKFAKRGNAEAIANVRPSTAIFISRSFLHEVDGNLEGTFTFEVWHHDFDRVQLYTGTNEAPGIIYQTSCG